MSRKKSDFDINNPQSVSERIRSIRIGSNLNQHQFGKKIGIAANSVSDLETGKKPPSDTLIIALEYRYSINPEWLLTGKGEMTLPHPKSGDRLPTVTYPLDSPVFALAEETSADDNFVLIPHVSGKISAGVGLVPENEVHVRVAFRKDWIRKKGQPDKMSLIKVKGDSMEPTLSSGDMILVDHSRNSIDPQGGIYAIVINDMIMIKRLHVLGTNKIRIVSDNPHYEPIEATADELQINGKVLWFCRELER